MKSNDGKLIASPVDSHGNSYTADENQKSVKVPNKSNNENEKQNDVKEVNHKKGKGFKFYANISKAGRNQNGEKKINQDTPLVHPSVGNIQGFNLFGVLDGHGPHGHFVSQFCREYFIKKFDNYAKQCINEGISTPEGIYNKLNDSKFQFIKESFREADLQMIKQKQFDYNFSGTTCNLVFQFNKYLVCANVGDSRGILICDEDNNKNQKIFPLSRDHKPDLPDELPRIQSKGGRVDKLTDQFGNKVGPNRVFKGELTYPGLAMSRSLGDFQAKDCGVISEPEINIFKTNHNSK
jgi:serine/threonine protein phosphatase PrpC